MTGFVFLPLGFHRTSPRPFGSALPHRVALKVTREALFVAFYPEILSIPGPEMQI